MFSKKILKKIEKILVYIDNQGIAISEFERRAGVSNGYVRNMADSNSEVSGRMWARIIKNIPELEKIESESNVHTIDTSLAKDRDPGEEQTNYIAPYDEEMYKRWLDRQRKSGHLTFYDEMVMKHISTTAATLMISEKMVDLEETRDLRVNTAMRDTEDYLKKRFLGN